MIEIYNSFNKDYNSNGDITLTPISCKYHVEMNTIYEVEVIHPYDKDGRWEYIKDGSVLKAPLPNKKYGLFKLLKPHKGMNSIIATGVPIAIFDLGKKVLPNILKITEKNGQEALDIILDDTKYTGHSDIVTIQNCTFFKNNIIEAINGEQENTFIKRWNGEFLPLNNDIYINNKLGGDFGTKIEYAFNLKEIGLERDLTNIVTRIYPYVIIETTDTIELPEKFVDSPLKNNYPDVYEKYIDFSEFMHLKDSENDIENAYETKEDLYIAMRNKCEELFDNGIDKPTVTGSVGMETLENKIEYKGFEDIVRVDLGDTVHITHTDINIESIERCVGFTWDMLNEKYLEINIGVLENNAFDEQNSAVSDLNNILNKNGTVNSERLQGVINALQTKFKALRDIAQPQEVRAILFEDRIKGSRTYGAMCLGSMGFEIASERTPDDKDWIWKTFGTGQGFFADWLVGKLRTVLIENMDGSFSIDLNKSGGAKFFNNGNLAMEIRNNGLSFFDWQGTDRLDPVGKIYSTRTEGAKNKPGFAIGNYRNSTFDIIYQSSDGHFYSYITFDKDNVLNNFKPIKINQDISLGNKSLFFGDDDFGQMYSSQGHDIVFKIKHGFGTLDKDTKNWTAFLGSDNVFFAHWKTGETYFSVNPNEFVMPGFWRSNGGEIWSGVTLNVDKNFHVNGNITCSGKKNRIVNTNHYGKRKLNAYETTECYFGDIGRGKLKNGKCIVRIDKIFLETVNTNIQYEVKTWAYGNGNVWVETKDMCPQYVIVRGSADIEFGYEIIAKQKDYENIRLEEVVKESTTSFSIPKNIKKEG